jgi:EmrB/QacA subfamily drug resistance transporter
MFEGGSAMALAATAPAPTPVTPYRWRWLVLATVLAVEVMDLLDGTIINVAAPTIRRSLGGSYTAIQWIAAGYTLAFAVMLITGGRLGDIVGRRRMFVLGAAGFTASSVLCAFAQSPEMLITSRVLQGALGAVMIPQGFGIIKQVFPPKELPVAFGAFGPVIGLSAVCGPILAGGLIDADWFGSGWRMIFFINVPLGLIAILAALRFMPESRTPGASRLDLPGTALVIAASLLLIYPLVQGRELDWPWWTFAMMVASVPTFMIFVAYERRRVGAPLIEMDLFANRAFAAGLVVIAGFFAGMIGLMLVFGLYVQAGLGYSPLHAGLTFAPWALGIAIGAGVAGAVLTARYGRRVIHSGLLVMAAGLVGLWATLAAVPGGPNSWQLAPSLLACGIGGGLTLAPLFNVILAGVRDHQVGSGSGVLNATQQFGGAVGVAMIGTLFFGALTGSAGAVTAAQAPALRADLAAVGVAAADQPRVIDGYSTCVADRFAQDDPDATSPSCGALGATVGQLGAPAQATGRILADAADEARLDDFRDSMRTVLWATTALVLATFALAFLLPRRARPDDAA